MLAYPSGKASDNGWLGRCGKALTIDDQKPDKLSADLVKSCRDVSELRSNSTRRSSPTRIAAFVHERLHGPFARLAAQTFLTSILVALAYLASGLLIARALGPSGRGAFTALTVIAIMIAWVFAIGSTQTITYFQARDADPRLGVLSTWLLLAIPLSAIALVVSELLLPTLLAAQPPRTLELGRVFMITVIVLLYTELFLGSLLGLHRFAFYNALRAGVPTVITLLYASLWAFHRLTIETALATYGAIQLISLVVLAVATLRRYDLSRFSIRTAKETSWYGIRARGAELGNLVNARFDLFIMPAFLSASSVGLYSVSASMSYTVFLLSSSLATVILPVATRRGQAGTQTITRSLQVTLVSGVAMGIVLMPGAELAVRVVYGADFLGSVAPFRILLPGAVLYGGAQILIAGLHSINRPFTATVVQGIGVIITVPGLLLFMPVGGITAAAIVSTVAYSVVFLFGLVAYKRCAGIAWCDFVPNRPLHGLRRGHHPAENLSCNAPDSVTHRAEEVG